MKNSLEFSTTDLRWQKKESTNFKMAQKKLSSLKNREKRKKKLNRTSETVGQHQALNIII